MRTFKPNQILKKLEIEGQRVVFRTPSRDDAKGCMDVLNSLIAKKAYLHRQKKISIKEEQKWIDKKISQLAENSRICVIIERGGEIIGHAEVWAWTGANNHLSDIGIILGKGVSEKILFETLEILEKIAKDNWNSRMMLAKFAFNDKNALKFYRKAGFSYVGRIPKSMNYYGNYIDEVLIFKKLVKF